MGLEKSAVVSLIAMAAFASACGVFGASDDPGSATPDVEGGVDGGLDGLPSEAGGPLTATPITVARGTQPVSLAADDADLYWADRNLGAIMAAPKLGGGTARKIAESKHDPDFISTDATYVYWLGTREECSVARVFRQQKGMTTPPEGIWGMDTYCYATRLMVRDAVSFTLFQAAGPGDILQIPLAGGNATPISGDDPTSLASDGSAIYWTIAAAGEVKKYLQPSGPVTVIAGSLPKPTELIVDATSLYWINEGDGTIVALQKSMPTAIPTTIAKGQTAARRLAVDDVSVYWTNQEEGTVKAAPKAGGGEVRTLAQGQLGPFAITVDAKGVYWSNLGDGTLRAVLK